MASEESEMEVPDSSNSAIPPANRKKTRKAGWKKNLSFIADPIKRRRFDIDNLRQIKKRITEWQKKTGAPMSFMMFLDGKICFAGSRQLKQIFRDGYVKKKIVNALKSTRPEESVDMIEIEEDWERKNCHRKREIVHSLVTCNKSKRIHWDRKDSEPRWWPRGVAFRNPASGSNKMTSAECALIIHTYIQLYRHVSEEEDELDNDEEEALGEECEVADQEVDGDTLWDRNGFTLERKPSEVTIMMEEIRAGGWETARLLAVSVYNRCRELLLGISPRKIGDNEIEPWLRHEIRQLLDDGIEPIHVAVGNEALYHSLSMCLFGKPNYWVHLKLGNLMYGIANEPKIVEKVKTGVDGIFKTDGSLLQFITQNFEIPDSVESDEAKIAYVYRNATLNCLDSNSEGGVIDLIIASNFLHSNIEIRYPSDMSQLNKLIPCDVHGLEAQPREIRLLAARSSPESSESSYFAPLCAIQDKVVPTQDESDANTLCLRPSRKTHRMVCKFCLRNYHKLCVGVDIEANVDTCGCYAMVELTERMNVFTDANYLRRVLATFCDQAKERITKLYRREELSCRRFIIYGPEERRERARPINSFFAVLSWEAFGVLQEFVEPLVDEIQPEPEPEPKHRSHAFYSHVAIPEVLVTIVACELDVGRLTANKLLLSRFDGYLVMK